MQWFPLHDQLPLPPFVLQLRAAAAVVAHKPQAASAVEKQSYCQTEACRNEAKKASAFQQQWLEVRKSSQKFTKLTGVKAKFTFWKYRKINNNNNVTTITIAANA